MRSLKKEFISLLEAGSDLLFPLSCLHCGQQLTNRRLPLLCRFCSQKIPFTTKPYCVCCGYPFTAGSNHLCGNCLTGSFAFDMARSVVLYKDMIPPMIQSFKYKGKMNSLASMGFLAHNCVGYRDFLKPDLIIPVPLHKNRLQKRGFNQALLLARTCFPKWRNCIFHDVLVRNRHTATQSNLSGVERRRNMKGAFTVQRADQITGKNILLVDDVFTTGTTVNECAKQLYRTGAFRVEIFTLARVV